MGGVGEGGRGVEQRWWGGVGGWGGREGGGRMGGRGG